MPAVGEPPRQLKGFTRVSLGAGQSKTVSVRLGATSFVHWNSAKHNWVITPGSYQIEVGDSSANLPLQTSLQRKGAALLSSAY